MRQTLVPVLMLAMVALSSSNVLPIMTTNRLDPNAVNGQQNDNTLRNRYSKPINSDIFYTPARSSASSQLMRKLVKYLNTNSGPAEDNFNDVIINEDDNYDGEGFRKEQWHNYPRQLDRLHEYLSEYRNDDTKRNLDTDDPGLQYYDQAESREKILGDIPTNEYLLDSNELNNNYDSVATATNPLLILKVHLDCLSNRLKNSRTSNLEQEAFQTQFRNEKVTNGLEEKLFTNKINPATKVKREGVTSQETGNSGENIPGKKKTKRLFSLWSRLQSLSHKGHELPHRRHLAFYGLPEADGGGGALTAETRATLMRPPGSPLRWG